MGVIYITHDLSLVAEIADKVIVMYKGSVVEAGSVKDIFLNAQHPYTKHCWRAGRFYIQKGNGCR